MSEEEWDIQKMHDLQRKHDGTKHVQKVLFEMPKMTAKKAIGQRINERYELYVAKLNSPRCEKQIVWKVARAVEEARIEEARIAAIFPRLENASNRGAYFLACAKGAFLAVGLSWHEEEWQDA